jgi:hypothetical protein
MPLECQVKGQHYTEKGKQNASGVWRLASGVWRLASGVWRLASKRNLGSAKNDFIRSKFLVKKRALSAK